MNVIIINLDVKKQLACKNRIILPSFTLHITRNVFYDVSYWLLVFSLFTFHFQVSI